MNNLLRIARECRYGIMITTILVTIVILAIIKLVLFKLSFSVYNGVECLVGKVALVTGGSKGIGLEVSKLLASRGCKVIIASRSGTEEQRQQLIKCTHNDNIVFMYVDLKSFSSVKKFAEEVHKNEQRIDILVNNAGVGYDSELTKDGFQGIIQCNVLSPFLLTKLLLDLLKKSDDGRIVFSSSICALYNNLSVDLLTAPPRLNNKHLLYDLELYGSTKVADIIVSNRLAAELKQYGIKSNCIHPGIIDTGIWDQMDKPKLNLFERIGRALTRIYIFFYSRTPKDGAQGIVALCVADKYKEFTGQFLWGLGMANIYPNPLVLKNKVLCEQVYNKIITLCER